MKVMIAVGVFFSLLVAQSGLAGGPPYKWTDEQGVVHFSDTPPPRKFQIPPPTPETPVETPQGDSASREPAPPPAETPAITPSAPDSPIQATHEMLLGKWRLDMAEVQDEINRQINQAPGKKNAEPLAKVGEELAGALVTGMIGSMRMEFTRDTVITEMMGEKQKMGYRVVRIENNVLTLKAEGKKNHAIIRVLDSTHLTFQEEGKTKGPPFTMVRDDSKPPANKKTPPK
jgi:hypothetical protein